MTACGDKVAYASEYLATNAATLHRFVHPDCTDVQPYLCRDNPNEPEHWHIGHQHRTDGLVCKTEEPLRPKWPRRRLYKNNHPTRSRGAA